ncbi:PD-(D/E)XK nuclease-like domain-containing protein [Bosea sp. BK604]|uniref:PD-(D/E)XK nuclease-like domain-containing protein n=1 Tax=Bosea sp. BK604 TaxID=2512180 RepID=UPI0010514503|nr:PD-(D/E)XK nuclease-like domain-containing protein [Bosea sp. BK604]TCR64660.1 PDDEXK-like uncharacterized protein DUF3799 [Bosea sp. BK604]
MTEPLRLPAGIHFDVAAKDYHADPAAEPSLSSSVANVLLTQSPRHAWQVHPRLNPEQPDETPTGAKEIGTAVHKLLLGRGASVVEIDAKDYRTNAAKEARSAAYDAGECPILKADYERATAMAEAVSKQLASIEGCDGFTAAAPEVVGICQDATGAWLRCMMDKLEERNGGAIIWDLKSGDLAAEPSGLGRRIANMGYEVQAAMYERIVITLRPDLAGRLRFRWIFVENEFPHLITVAELDNAGLEIGRKKVSAAIGLWNRCIQAGNWPGYPAQIVLAEYPPFAESAWLTRELDDERLRGLGNDPFLMRAPWQPPRPQRHQLSEIAS